MKSALALLAVLTANVAVPASAEDWRLVSLSTDNRAAFFIDLDTLKSESDTIRRATVLVVIGSGLERFAALKAESKFDCSANKIHLGRSVAYNDAAAVVTVEEDNPTEPWEVMKPDSNFINTAEIVCGRKPVSNEKFGPDLPIAPARALLAKRVQTQAT